MPDDRFFPPAGPFTLSFLADLCGARLDGEAERLVSNVAPLHSATADDVSFVHSRSYMDQFRASSAGCCITSEGLARQAPPSMALLVTDQPYLAYARVATAFHPASGQSYLCGDGEEPVHASATIGEGTRLGRGTVVGPGAVIGRNCRIGPNAYIGDEVRIGDNCHVGPGVSIRFALVGDRVSIFAGARIGEPGFGFAISSSGAVTIPQVGRVILEDDVEVGANTTIDRGSGPDTIIGRGTRLDNLVQIGHNVRIGQRCILTGMVGIAGSARIGDGVLIGGQAGVAGHISVGDGAQIASKSGIIRDVAPGERVMGLPAVPVRQFFRQFAMLSRLSTKR